MALFGRKKTSNTTASASKAVSATPRPEGSAAIERNLASVIVKPRITEKAVGQSERNVYTFVVRPDANKYDVRDAVKELFNVTPVKIRIVNKSPRQFTSRRLGRTVTEKGMKKAYVYLKQGDSINLV